MTISTKELRTLEHLHNYAKEVNFDHKQRLAAAIVKKGDIIGIGHNKMKTHPIQRKFGKNDEAIYLHAETSAILDAINRGEDPNGGVMYVIRRMRDESLGLARPCCGCMRALAAYGIDRVVYSNEVGSYSVEIRD